MTLEAEKIDAEDSDSQTLTNLIRRYENAKARRQNWEPHWREAYQYALPQRNRFDAIHRQGTSSHDQLYDATALDAVEQLASSLLASITPPLSQWFGLKPGPDLSRRESQLLAPALEQAARTVQNHFDRSNFIVEIHQCYLDLIVGGTAVLAFEEAPPRCLIGLPVFCRTIKPHYFGRGGRWLFKRLFPHAVINIVTITRTLSFGRFAGTHQA